MAKNIWLISFLVMSLIFSGCSNDDEPDLALTPSPALSGPDLLGLVDGRQLEYLLIDSVVTWIPGYHVQEDTGTQVIRVAGDGSDWIIKNDTVPILNLKVSDPFILQNGYWRKVGSSDALVYFPVPAVVLDRSAVQNHPWSSFMPAFTSDTGDISYIFYYSYFGFYFIKSFAGTEQVLVPAFGGDAYRYEIQLFGEEDDMGPIATLTEHYAPGIGLVRQEFRAEGVTRILSLRSYN